MENLMIDPAGQGQDGPFTTSFSWRAQLGAAVFALGLRGDVGAATRVALWGRPWTRQDACYGWDAGDWYQFAVKVVLLSITAGQPRPENRPIEPTSVEALLLAAFGPRPPDATYHLPPVSRPVPAGGAG